MRQMSGKKAIFLKLKYYLQKQMFKIADFAMGLWIFYPLVGFMVNPTFQLSATCFLGWSPFYSFFAIKLLLKRWNKLYRFNQRADILLSDPWIDFAIRTSMSFAIFVFIVQMPTIPMLFLTASLAGLIGILFFPIIRKILPSSLDKFSIFGSIYFEKLNQKLNFSSFLKRNDLHKGVQVAAKYYQDENLSRLLYKVAAADFGFDSPFRNLEIISELVKLGADVNVNLNGLSLLAQIIQLASLRTAVNMHSELENDKAIIRYLVENGADINQKITRNRRPDCSLLYANVLAIHTPEIFKLMLELGIDMSKGDPLLEIMHVLSLKLQDTTWRQVMVEHYQQLAPLQRKVKSLKDLVSLSIHRHEKTKPVSSRNRFLLPPEEQRALDPTKPVDCLPVEVIDYYLKISVRKNNLKFYSRMIEQKPQLAEYFIKPSFS